MSETFALESRAHDADRIAPAAPILSVDLRDTALSVDRTVRTVTPADAALIRDKYTFHRQRRINADRVRHYKTTIEKGHWLANNQIRFAYVVAENRHILINGHHRLDAVIAAGVPTAFEIAVVTVATLAEAEALYAIEDTGRPRSASDSVRALGAEERLGLSGTMVDKATAAVRAITCGLFGMTFDTVGAARKSVDAFAVEDNLAPVLTQIKQYEECISLAPGSRRKVFLRVPMLAAGILTLRSVPGVATTFWSGLAADDGLARNDPRKALLLWLESASYFANTNYHREHAKAIALAWNAHVSGNTLTFIRTGHKGFTPGEEPVFPKMKGCKVTL